ncbi:MAG: PAS domain S-box protein [Deltaproteobacteria bacterium]|nr:PAS domain S-box protein [Deltaproteobacteria bacterium]
MQAEPKKPLILIVDDNLANLKLLERVLISEYEVKFAANGPQAIEYARTKPNPDLILLDIVMPVMDGYEVCRCLKSDEITNDIPVIFVTTKDAEEDETRGLALGAVDYITRPIRPEIVKARVKNHLNQKRYKEFLQQSEEKYRQLVQSANSIILRMDTEGKITFFNPYAEKFFGYSEKEILGKNILGTIMPLTDLHGRPLKPVLEDIIRHPDHHENYENENIRRDGSRIWVSWTTNAIRDESDDISEILCIGNDITKLKCAEEAVRDNEKYLKAIMETIQAGVVIVDSISGKIVDANPSALRMIGSREKSLIGTDIGRYLYHVEESSKGYVSEADCELRMANGRRIHVRRTSQSVKIKERAYTVHSFLDISDIKDLFKKQEISIELAKKILNLINRPIARNIDLGNEEILFADTLCVPCYAEGGDHYFIRGLKTNGGEKTVISLKDQSGHQVGCILRSIVTDRIHHTILTRRSSSSLENILAELNEEIFQSGILGEADFFSSITVELDHKTRKLTYASAGHPPFLLIRGNDVSCLPALNEPGLNLPFGVSEDAEFSAGTITLKTGDRLILYTDGLTEMPVKNRGTIISIEELKSIVHDIIKKTPDAPVVDIMAGMLQVVSEMSEEKVIPPDKNTSGDDVTLIGLEIESLCGCRTDVFRVKNSAEVSMNITEIYDCIKKEWQKRRFRTPVEHVRIALEEAVLNAWKHGNRRDPKKAITVRYRFGNDFHLEVIDEGQGFDYRNRPDPTTKENLTCTEGRGLFLIHYYADGVEWKHNGRHIGMYFRKHPNCAG